MPRLTYQCPTGGSLILARTQRELDRKVNAHHIIAHGANALVVCNGPVVSPERAAEARTMEARLTRPAPRMGYSLARRA